MYSTDGCVSAAVEVTLMFMQYDRNLRMITEGKTAFVGIYVLGSFAVISRS